MDEVDVDNGEVMRGECVMQRGRWDDLGDGKGSEGEGGICTGEVEKLGNAARKREKVESVLRGGSCCAQGGCGEATEQMGL